MTVETNSANKCSDDENLNVKLSKVCDPEEDESEDAALRRERRLMQNRKSAKKCRLKKKAEFSKLSSGVDGIQQENVDLKVKLNDITVMLY